MSESGIFPSDEWVLATGQTDNGPMILRYRSGDPEWKCQARFSKLVIVKWEYEPSADTGLPDSTTLDAMDEFEDCILEITDASGNWGAGVAVMTHNAAREWRFYTPDVDIFVTEFSAALSGLGPYPIELTAFDDPEWNGLSELRDMARGNG